MPPSTFKLRQGVKFPTAASSPPTMWSTHRRVCSTPRPSSPGAGFYLGIKGAQEFIDGNGNDRRRHQGARPYTVQFTLTAPDVTFLNKMALNFAFIVPKEEVEKAGENFGHAPVGTGPSP